MMEIPGNVDNYSLSGNAVDVQMSPARSILMTLINSPSSNSGMHQKIHQT
jgi:hypothetical protein